MRSGIWLASLALSAVVSGATEAATQGFAVSFDKLYHINLETGATDLVGNIGHSDVEGLAIAPDGTLFGASDATKTLIMIDKRTGRGVPVGGLVGNLGLSGQGSGQFDAMDFGLSFSCDGKLWLSSDATSKFWEVNPGTGETRFVGNLGARITGLGARGDGVYGFGSGGDENFYKINLNNGQAVLIDTLANGSPIADGGLDADELGNLWGIFDYRPPDDTRASDIVQINHKTGLIRKVATTLQEMEGLAIAPVRPCGEDPPPPRGPGVVSIPVAGPIGLAALILSILTFGVAGFARARRF